VLNNSKNIKKSILSFQSQTYNNKEQIIIDGGSNDGTLEVIKNLKQKNINLISSSDNSIYEALNKGIKFSKGKIIGILHSDDFYENKKILEIVYEAFNLSGADLVYGDLVYISKNYPYKKIRYWKAGKYLNGNLKSGWMPPHPAVFIKKSVINKIGHYNQKFNISSDYDFLVRAFKYKGLKKFYIPKIFIKMRIGGKSNESIKNLFIKSYEDYLIIKKNNIGGILTLIKKNFSKLNQFF
tara:strand:- start:14306 stop:15022 length:717 start_codon:yes stop_codon:yes gene_type:complete